MKHIQKIILLTIAFVFSVAMATTAVVDVKSIIEGTDIMKGAAADMEKKFAPQRDELMAMQKTSKRIQSVYLRTKLL